MLLRFMKSSNPHLFTVVDDRDNVLGHIRKMDGDLGCEWRFGITQWKLNVSGVAPTQVMAQRFVVDIATTAEDLSMDCGTGFYEPSKESIN